MNELQSRSMSTCVEVKMGKKKKVRATAPKKKPPETRQLLTYAQLEAEFGISRNTLYSLVCRKRIPHIRLGRRFVRFQLVELQRWFAQHMVTPTTTKGVC